MMYNLFILVTEEDYDPLHIEEDLSSMYNYIKKSEEAFSKHLVDEHNTKGSISTISVNQLMELDEESVPKSILDIN